jgi:geranylgeranylglycerol-phosphate geranylgeranyltransferase
LEKIASDAMDVKWDQLRSSESLAKKRGRGLAVRISVAVFSVFFAQTLLPFLAGWLGYDCLLLVALMDLRMIWCTTKLVRARTPEEGRLKIRRLYLAWGLFFIVFAVSRIL